jgi:hypothetical protein
MRWETVPGLAAAARAAIVRTRMLGECWADSDPEFSHVFVGVELERFSLGEQSASGSQ